MLKVADAWVGLAGDVTAEVLRLARAVTHPTRAIESARTAVLGMGRFVGNLGATPHVSIEGTIGPHRAWAHSVAELSHVKVIRNAFGGTVNDVVLAAVSGGYRDLLLARGDDVDHARRCARSCPCRRVATTAAAWPTTASRRSSTTSPSVSPIPSSGSARCGPRWASCKALAHGRGR